MSARTTSGSRLAYYGDGTPWNPPSPHSLGNRLLRFVWSVVWLFLFRPSPVCLRGWRRFLLRVFGARIGDGAYIHPSARIWAPWHLSMGKSAVLSHSVDCYCVASVTLEDYAIVSQYSFLCTASHDYTDECRPVTASPITIEARAWLCADIFVGPGVTVGHDAVVGARSSVFRDVPPWAVAVGSPARRIRDRRCARPSAGSPVG